MDLDAMILVFWILSFKSTFSLSSFTFIKRFFSSSLSATRVVSSAYLRLLTFRLCFSFFSQHIPVQESDMSTKKTCPGSILVAPGKSVSRRTQYPDTTSQIWVLSPVAPVKPSKPTNQIQMLDKPCKLSLLQMTYFLFFLKWMFSFLLFDCSGSCCVQFFFSCQEQGLFLTAAHGLLITGAPLVVERRL